MVDKWTVGSIKEGLYNGVKPPEEGGTREKKKEYQGRVTVASGRTSSETTILSKNILLGHYQITPYLLLGLEIITCLCVLFSSDKLLTSINCCKTLYQPNSFAHSLTNSLYWAYWAHPLFLPGFGLRFVTLQWSLFWKIALNAYPFTHFKRDV